MSACFAHDIVQNYRLHHWHAANAVMAGFSVPGRADSRAIWFGLDRLKRFIYEIESRTGQNHNAFYPNGYPQLGIRIYFAEYPDSSLWSLQSSELHAKGYLTTDLPYTSDFANTHTLILVPTYQKDGMDIDFDASTGGGFTCTRGDSATALILAPTIMNHGDENPPPWKCSVNPVGPVPPDQLNSWSHGCTFMGFADDDICNYEGTASSNPTDIEPKCGNNCPTPLHE
jgi:hypothetical protein